MPVARGFTLVEVLVVTVVIALAGSAVLLAAGAGQPRQLQTEARHLVQVVQQLSDQAMRQRHPYGLRLDAHGYQVLQWQARDARWLAVPAWPPRRLPAGISLTLETDSTADAAPGAAGGMPQLLIGADQQWTAFSLQLSTAAHALRVHSDGLNGPLIEQVQRP